MERLGTLRDIECCQLHDGFHIHIYPPSDHLSEMFGSGIGSCLLTDSIVFEVSDGEDIFSDYRHIESSSYDRLG